MKKRERKPKMDTLLDRHYGRLTDKQIRKYAFWTALWNIVLKIIPWWKPKGSK